MNSTQLITRPSRLRRRAAAATLIAGIVAVGMTLAGCTSGSPDSSATGGSSNGSADGVTIAVMGGASSDLFWSTVKNGAESAAKSVEAAGGKVTFVSMPNYDNFSSDAAKLVGNLQAMNPDAVVLPNWVPDAQNANIQAISDAGIPVIIYNAGQETVGDVGGEIYIGTDDYEAGVAGGKKLEDDGYAHILCVNTLPGVANVDARCEGIHEGASGTKVTDLNLPSTQFGDPTAIKEAIKGALLQDPSVDVVITIGTADADSAAAALEQGSLTEKVGLASFDVAETVLNRIADGTQLFTIDQQPFAQGYYAVANAFQLAAYGIKLPEERILTGPALITSDNVDLAIQGTKNGVR